MDFLIELMLEIVIGGSIEGAAGDKVPQGIRIVLMIFISIIFLIFTGVLVWLIFVSKNILVKILLAGVAVLLIVGLINLWSRFIKRQK